MRMLVYSPISLRFGGGFERWILEVATRLRKFGVYTQVLCTASTLGDEERISYEEIMGVLSRASADYSELPCTRFSLFGSNSPIPRVSGLRRLLNEKDYDLLYFPNAYAFQDLLISALRLTHRRPVISGQHAVLFQDSLFHDVYVSAVTKRLLRVFDAYHVLNSDDMRVFEEWGLSKIYLIPIGIDTNKFKPRKSETASRSFRLLFVGRMTSQKGIDVLCQSVSIVNQDHDLQKNMQFIMAGSGPMSHMIEKLSKQYKNVQYLGRVPDGKLPEIYRSSDVLLMPSRSETFGIVAIEAQASGLPVIATNIPGPREILVDGVTGRLMRSNNPATLALAIRDLYGLWSNDREKFEKMRKDSRINAERRFGWEIIINQIYNMILETHSGLERRREKRMILD